MTTVAECIAAIDRSRQPAPESYARRVKRFRASASWHRLRVSALAANRAAHGSQNCCELCGTDTGPWHADHIIPTSKDWSRRLDPENIQILCRDCNFGKLNLYSEDWRKESGEHAEHC